MLEVANHMDENLGSSPRINILYHLEVDLENIGYSQANALVHQNGQENWWVRHPSRSDVSRTSHEKRISPLTRAKIKKR